MTQMMDLNKMGLVPMTEFEMQEVDGGALWAWFLGAAGAVVGFLVGGPVGAFEGAFLGFSAGLAIDLNEGHADPTRIRFVD